MRECMEILKKSKIAYLKFYTDAKSYESQVRIDKFSNIEQKVSFNYWDMNVVSDYV